MRDVRKIFMESMDGTLAEHLREQIEKQLGATIKIVSRKEEADAIFQGEIISRGDTRSRVTGGYLGIKDENMGVATLTDLTGKVVLWKGEAGDKSPILGIVKRDRSKKIAERLIKDLKDKLMN